MTTMGALAGGLTAVLLPSRVLYGLFGFILIYVVYSMGRLPKSGMPSGPTGMLTDTMASLVWLSPCPTYTAPAAEEVAMTQVMLTPIAVLIGMPKKSVKIG